MKLTDALKVIQELTTDAPPLDVKLACGFTPLHLETLLRAELCLQFPDRSPRVKTGLYGDLVGSLERLHDVSAAVVVIEWADLDPRLGLRALGGWEPSQLADILANSRGKCDLIQHAVETAAKNAPVVGCFPTLPLPPVSFTHGARANELVLELRSLVASLSVSVARVPNVRVVDPQRINALSDSGRLDVKSDLLTGFPYTLPHASVLAELLAWLVRNPLPKKGLITDLDETLWNGILGEVGSEGISWDLDNHGQIHGLYQQLLRSLAASGTLIAVASKSDPKLVVEAFARKDIVLRKTDVFPFEVHWGTKSESVSRILSVWNISADSVVFVDDNPMELAEVKTIHPELECLLFRGRDYQASYELIRRLRDLFGKDRILEEDSLRADGLRAYAAIQRNESKMSSDPSEFQQQLGAKLTFSFKKLPVDPRTLELVNKTNQFNLNGFRYSEAGWRHLLEQEETILLTVSYTDKFGPLGKIAVLGGRLDVGDGSGQRKLYVQTWVMSCRAFSRLIEYMCLQHLFSKLEVEQIGFNFVPTGRNRPMQDFLRQLHGRLAESSFCVSRAHYAKTCPSLSHTVEEAK